MPATPDVRLRTKRVLTRQIAATAIPLFAKHGFAQTSIDAIAEAAGISRRTFFRYFETKEDVLASFIGEHDIFVPQLEARPPHETPWEALHGAFATLLGTVSERALEIIQLILHTPRVRARYLERLQVDLRQLALPEIERRLQPPSSGPGDLRASAILAALSRREPLRQPPRCAYYSNNTLGFIPPPL